MKESDKSNIVQPQVEAVAKPKPKSKPATKPATKAKAKAKAEPKAAAAKPAAKKAPAKAKSKAKGDDLTRIEGIGPKIAELLHGADINTFAELAATDADKLKEVLHDAGSRFAAHDPTTWPQQAKLAADGDFDGLNELQDHLKGGRPA
ncbi:MAG: helix-hairpin-helix domain-containing protein [Rhodanobacteraceae bacterium]